MLTAHRLSFPTCLFHPRSIHLLCHLDSPSAANLPCLGLQQQTGPEVSELCGSYRVPSRSSLLPLRTLSPGENRSQANNLFFQPQSPLSPGESVVPLVNKPHAVQHCVATQPTGKTDTGFPTGSTMAGHFLFLNPATQDRLTLWLSGTRDKQSMQGSTQVWTIQTEDILRNKHRLPEVNTGLPRNHTGLLSDFRNARRSSCRVQTVSCSGQSRVEWQRGTPLTAHLGHFIRMHQG
jgi:hypothetical protein